MLGVSAEAGTGVVALAETLAEHRAHLETSGELARRRSSSRTAWALELFERRFGSLGVEKLGGLEGARAVCAGASGSALDAFSDLASRAGLST